MNYENLTDEDLKSLAKVATKKLDMAKLDTIRRIQCINDKNRGLSREQLLEAIKIENVGPQFKGTPEPVSTDPIAKFDITPEKMNKISDQFAEDYAKVLLEGAIVLTLIKITETTPLPEDVVMFINRDENKWCKGYIGTDEKFYTSFGEEVEWEVKYWSEVKIMRKKDNNEG